MKRGNIWISLGERENILTGGLVTLSSRSDRACSEGQLIRAILTSDRGCSGRLSPLYLSQIEHILNVGYFLLSISQKEDVLKGGSVPLSIGCSEGWLCKACSEGELILSILISYRECSA